MPSISANSQTKKFDIDSVQLKKAVIVFVSYEGCKAERDTLYKIVENKDFVIDKSAKEIKLKDEKLVAKDEEIKTLNLIANTTEEKHKVETKHIKRQRNKAIFVAVAEGLVIVVGITLTIISGK